MDDSRLKALRSLMAENGIDLYYVPSADDHETEYVVDHFEARRFLTGFTGDAGVAVVTKDRAGLWTDGRFFIQAEEQLKGSGFSLYAMGQEGVPTVEEFMAAELPQGGVIGFDGKVVNTRDGRAFERIAAAKGGALKTDRDLADVIWTDRPPLASSPVFALEEKYCGENTASKLSRIRAKMREAGTGWHLVSSLEEIAWILNVRGNDIPSVPVIYSFLLIGEDRADWFVDEHCVSDGIQKTLTAAGVSLRPYDAVYEAVSCLPAGSSVLLDTGKVNYRLTGLLPESVTICDADDPALLMKAVKNNTEIANIREAHICDGIAVARFMHWLKTNIGKIPMTELSVSDYLESLRAAQPGFVEISFTTISAYQANAAMMHYAPTPENNAELKPECFLLVDSGGHYLTGSTDITRTFVLGPITAQQKRDFTLVVKGNLNLANQKFLYGCTGLNLDILCRSSLWNLGIDYQCGTGHGVGYLLCVHEGPNGFRWKDRRGANCVLEAGMVTTDEPGVYIGGEYGIRIENELLCKKAEKNFYGQFLEFENITYAPIDLDAIDPSLLSDADLKQLNDYHARVYETLAPRMEEDERVWLREYTRPLER